MGEGRPKIHILMTFFVFVSILFYPILTSLILLVLMIEKLLLLLILKLLVQRLKDQRSRSIMMMIITLTRFVTILGERSSLSVRGSFVPKPPFRGRRGFLWKIRGRIRRGVSFFEERRHLLVVEITKLDQEHRLITQ
jgi:hypothetical protein